MNYRRHFTDGKYCLLRRDSDKSNLRLPRYSAARIIPDVESIPVTLVDYEDAHKEMMSYYELRTLCKIVRWKQPRVVFEIGTYLGETTLQLAVNSNAEVYTLDLPPRGHRSYVGPKIRDPELDVYPDYLGIRFQNSPYAERIHQLYGDSQAYDFTPYYSTADLVLVDGCHHYEFVLRDTQNALKIIRPNGIIVWHDYASYAPGVVQVLNDFRNAVPLVHIDGTSFVINSPTEERFYWKYRSSSPRTTE